MNIIKTFRDGLDRLSKRGQYAEAFGRGEPLTGLVSPRRAILGEGMTEGKALAVAAIYACVRILAEGVANMPFELTQEVADGSWKSATDEDEYWLFADRPNPEDTKREFLESYMASILLHGNGFAHSWRNNRGRCTELTYLDPGLVSPSRVKGQLVYRATEMTTGNSLTLFQGDSMLHCKRFRRDTWSGMGLSVLGYHRETFGLATAQQEFQESIYANGTTPRGILSSEQDIDDKQIARIRRQWRERYAGATNAGETPVLPLGLKFMATSMLPEDAAMVENFSFTERQVAQIFGVPLYRLWNYKDVRFATSEQQQIDFITNSLMPWAKVIEDTFNTNLLTSVQRKRGLKFRFDEKDLARGATKDQHDTHAVDIQNGIKSRNEVRLELGLKPMPGCDDLLVPMNMVTQVQKNIEIDQQKKAAEKAEENDDLANPAAVDPMADEEEPTDQQQPADGKTAKQKQAEGNGGTKPAPKGISNNPAGQTKKRTKAEEALLANVADALGRVVSKERKATAGKSGDEIRKALGDHAGYFRNVMRSSLRNAAAGLSSVDVVDADFDEWLEGTAADYADDRMTDLVDGDGDAEEDQKLVELTAKLIDDLTNYLDLLRSESDE